MREKKKSLKKSVLKNMQDSAKKSQKTCKKSKVAGLCKKRKEIIIFMLTAITCFMLMNNRLSQITAVKEVAITFSGV